MKKLFLNLTLFAAFALGTTQAQIISFDFQSGSNTETGFTAISSAPISATSSGVTLSTSTAPSGFRDRGETAPITGNPDVNILRDLAFWSTGDAIVFNLSGLDANTEYEGIFWVFDSESGNSGKNIDFITAGGSGGGTTSITTNNTDASANPYSFANFFSTASGTATITMDHTGGAGGAVSLINGLQLEVVPEPSSFAMMVMGGAALLCIRRRRASRG